jgi:predicted aspartyl protease
VAKHLFPPGHPDPRGLEKFGPRLEIEVGPPIFGSRPDLRLPRSSDPGDKRFSRMPALVDTGAGRTVLTPLAIQTIGLSVVDYTKLCRAGGIEDRVAVHVASIRFPRDQMATIEVIQVLCCELPEQPIQCLIGRDILSRWLFTYNGKTGGWSIDEEDQTAWVEPPIEDLWS